MKNMDPITFYQLVDYKADLINKIDQMMVHQHEFKSLQRAEKILGDLKQEKYLQRVEMALQITIDEVLSLWHRPLRQIDERQAANFVYALQSMILALPSWPLPNQQVNHYEPLILKKYHKILQNAMAIGIDSTTLSKACFSYEFAKYGVRFLDDKRMDEILIKLKIAKGRVDPVNFLNSLKSNKLSQLKLYHRSKEKQT